MTYSTHASLHLRCALAGALLAAGAWAQSIPSEARTFTPWPDPSGPDATKVVSGRFVDAANLDVAVLQGAAVGGAVALLMEPARFNYTVSSVEAHDMVLVPGAASNGRDGLAILGPEGLSLLLVNDADVGFVAADILDSSWITATKLWCVTNSSGGRELLAWHPTSATLLRATWSVATQTLSWAAAVTPELPVDDVVGLQFDTPQTAHELVFVMGGWLSVRSWNGAALGAPMWIGADTAPAPGRRMFAALKRPGAADALAFHVWSPALSQFLVGAFNASNAWPTVLMGPDYRGSSLAVADYNADQYDDLVLMDATSDDGRLVSGSATAGLALATTPGSVFAFDAGVCVSGEFDFVGAGDFDRDEDVDVLALDGETGRRTLFSSAVKTQVVPQIGRVPGSRLVVTPPEPGGDFWTSLTLTATVPPAVFDGSSPATHLHITGWFMPDVIATPLEIQAEGSVLASVALTPSTQLQNLNVPVVWLSNPLVEFDAGLYISARFVRKVGSTYERVWPAATYFYEYSGIHNAIPTWVSHSVGGCDAIGGSGNDGTVGGGRPNTGGGDGPPRPSTP
jgi:hypothetical protein